MLFYNIKGKPDSKNEVDVMMLYMLGMLCFYDVRYARYVRL